MKTNHFEAATNQYVATKFHVLSVVGIAIVGTGALLYVFSSADEIVDDDQVFASFERDMNHRPAPAAIVTRSAIDEDILYDRINSISWTKEEKQLDANSSVGSGSGDLRCKAYGFDCHDLESAQSSKAGL